MNLLKTTIGIEFGSTRIKGVMIDDNFQIIAQGFYDWENKLVNGIWTYDMDEIINGLQTCFKDLKSDFERKFGEPLTTTGAIGISGMMHGYLVFDKNGKQISEFRTWRNTITEQAASTLTEKFNFNIPQRWSIAHIYQAILNNEEGVNDIDFATTLAGYIHYRLTGERVIGIGEGSGIFPVDTSKVSYDENMIDIFNQLVEGKVSWKILDILPKNLLAGVNAGYLTDDGAKLLDPTGTLKPGIPLCPPEGDMGTGMTATNSVRANTGNVSIGTSSNATILTNKKIGLYRELDVIVSPSGVDAALVHVNNGTSDINAWVNLLAETLELMGHTVNKGELYTKLFTSSLEGDADGLMSFNYYSGEPIPKFFEGRPLLIRDPSKKMHIGDFMKMHIYSVLTTIRMGMDILVNKENVQINKVYGHGGFFKTPVVGQRMLSAALKTPVLTLSSAGEGGPYGMALLAGYYVFKEENETLEDFLDQKVFANSSSSLEKASEEEIAKFDKYYQVFLDTLTVESEAIKTLKVGEIDA
jgi:sugar (pentulose or hexulose) kinase